MSDQEGAIRAVIAAALAHCEKPGEWTDAVPEMSAVGESQSIGRAERTVQTVEDKVRAHKSALEARINARVPVDHPIMKWLVEYVGILLTKYTINATGLSPYEELHGHPVRERPVEFGERRLFVLPKSKRAKLDLRCAGWAWPTGMSRARGRLCD